MIFTLIELAIIVILCHQIVVPLLFSTPIFPFFREKPLQDELTEVKQQVKEKQIKTEINNVKRELKGKK